MPAGYAHLTISNEALKIFRNEEPVSAELRNQTERHLSFIHSGSVAPDYPYLRLRDSEQALWADHMHYEFTGDILQTMARGLLDVLSEQGFTAEEFAIPFSWTLGYISHVTADLVIHPFVYNIVGSYKGHEDDHRSCEMIQDAFIYKEKAGQEIKESRLLEKMAECSDPADKNKIHPVIKKFWSELLQTHFSYDFRMTPPDIDDWHENYLDLMQFAGDPPFLGKSISSLIKPEAPYTYRQTGKMTFADKAIYRHEFRLPGGGFGTYEKDVFPKAVSCVADKWTQLGRALTLRDLGPFLEGIVNCDLDTGYEISKLRYW